MAHHGPTVFRVCRAVLGPQEAEDAWSETFLSALQAYPKLSAGSDVRAWLVTIAHRRAIDAYRRAVRRPVPAESVPERPIPAPPDAPDAAVLATLAALPFKQRAAVAYRYLADMSYADIGALLDSSPPAARRSAADGIAALRLALGPPPAARTAARPTTRFIEEPT